ncbi:DUF4230 domain-containing protein [Coprococcus sp. AF16-5]|uniref:DUF4230 domain-containing protein n=1 Tax=Coprococcus sp. AF16-5 TaxID=2293088 RepID=UPI000E4907AD|nr:DUF4230 domain-containing protein [Coprococcus sp. AF16-5]RHR64752.1 DUF4230 domain-containing protein [Coprococcus sp. AF16-5]
MKKISTFLLKAFILILFCVITFFITRYLYVPKGQKIKKTDSAIGKTIELSGETIRSNIANIGKLATAEYTYTHVEHFDSSRTIGDFKIPLTKTSYIFSYDGTIIAGVDFTKTNVNKNDTSKTITITLPEVEIISSDVDQDSFQLYDEKKNIFNPTDITDYVESFADLKTSEEQKAIDKGLLDDAKANACTIINSYMASLNIPNYTTNITFAGTTN